MPILTKMTIEGLEYTTTTRIRASSVWCRNAICNLRVHDVEFCAKGEDPYGVPHAILRWAEEPAPPNS